jgi:hypothetical protein
MNSFSTKKAGKRLFEDFCREVAEAAEAEIARELTEKKRALQLASQQGNHEDFARALVDFHRFRVLKAANLVR